MRNWGIEGLRNLPNTTQLVGVITTQEAWLQSPVPLMATPDCPFLQSTLLCPSVRYQTKDKSKKQPLALRNTQSEVED